MSSSTVRMSFQTFAYLTRGSRHGEQQRVPAEAGHQRPGVDVSGVLTERQLQADEEEPGTDDVERVAGRDPGKHGVPGGRRLGIGLRR